MVEPSLSAYLTNSLPRRTPLTLVALAGKPESERSEEAVTVVRVSAVTAERTVM